MSRFKELYEAAGGHSGVGYPRLVSQAGKHGHKVDKRRFTDWFNKMPPTKEHAKCVRDVLIPFLEDLAEVHSPGYRKAPPGSWDVWLTTTQSLSDSGRGGPGPRVHGSSRGRLLCGASPALLQVLPSVLEGRDEELAALQAFVKAPDGAPSYLWWQAGPWAGKTALVSWFAAQTLPAGVDVAHYVISRRLGTDRRDGFVQAVKEQLGAAAGKRRYPSVTVKQPNLEPLYRAAAQECEQHKRRLVLIVDGLDEDADVDVVSTGIAGLLPKAPQPNMRVIVTGRAHPRVPVNLPPDHPLRDPAVTRQLAPSPAAQIIRDMAVAELRVLRDDRALGRPLLGLLAAARGALTAEDLGELLEVPACDVEDKLRTVVSRSLTPTRADLLPLGVRTAEEERAGRQTLVLAHDVLHRAACQDLGKPFLAQRIDDLHRWAEGYRSEQWPEETPNYLLTGYIRLLQDTSDIDRLAALVLDPHYQLRLAQRSGADVALAHLRLLAPRHTDHALSLDRAAAAAASREMLRGHVQPLPGAVAQAVARLGDPGRARALVVASGTAVNKALGLADVADVVHAMDEQEAVVTAREAEKWARVALREADRHGYVTDDAEGAAAQAALALLATARGSGLRQQYADALDLLRSTRGTGTARTEAWVRAAGLLAPDHPQDAAQLLDELEDQAEALAGGGPAAVAGAVQLWQMVATAAPDRADRLRDLALEHVTPAWQDAPSLETVAVLAATASFVAPTRQAPAGQLVATACDYVERALDPDTRQLSPVDAFHREFGLTHTLAVLAQALTDVGAPPEAADRIRDFGPHSAVPPEHLTEAEDHVFDEATALARRALHLAGRGSVDDAEHHLQQALALLSLSGPGDRSPVWLPDLAGALVRTGAAAETGSLLTSARHPDACVRVHAAIALAHADGLRPAEARHHAREAAREASGKSWPYAAQALAGAGEVESAVGLIEQHGQPRNPGGRAAWRKADRAARVAVAAELASHAPEAAYELVRPLLERLHSARNTIRSQGLLLPPAELRPALVPAPPAHQQLFHTVLEAAREQATRGNPRSWRSEDVLIEAFLRIADGEVPGRQVDWLTRDLAGRGTAYSATAALAVLHAALDDTATAYRVAMLPAAPHRRAAALTAVAARLARVPCRPHPVADPIGTDAFTHTVLYLAQHMTPAGPPAPEPAARALNDAMTASGWHHTLPVLAHLAPETIATVSRIATTHLGTP
ncbi:hypothetical protein JCM13580A_24170 [Streptomyces drozdowiczii]